jgi:small-conductance mechanosensitive channel
MNKANTITLLEEFADQITVILPDLLLATVILLLGFLIGKLVKGLVKRFILYLNTRLNQRFLSSSVSIELQGTAAFVSSAFFWIIISVTVLICINILRLDFLGDLFEEIINYLPNILAAIVIIFAGIIFGRLFSDLLRSTLARTGLVANRRVLINGVRYFTIFVAVMIAADQLGIQVKFLIGVIDIVLAALLFGAALAFGLGAQHSVSNILGSYYAKKDYQTGMQIKYNDLNGVIVKITDHAIHLETAEGRTIIPAKNFNEATVTIIKEGEDV